MTRARRPAASVAAEFVDAGVARHASNRPSTCAAPAEWTIVSPGNTESPSGFTAGRTVGRLLRYGTQNRPSVPTDRSEWAVGSNGAGQRRVRECSNVGQDGRHASRGPCARLRTTGVATAAIGRRLSASKSFSSPRSFCSLPPPNANHGSVEG